MSDFKQHLARQCAVGRHAFGPDERTDGVIDHISKELIEIKAEDTPAGRAKEWVDVSILGLDGLLRAVRQLIRDRWAELGLDGPEQVGEDGSTTGWNGEPTNEYVAGIALRMLVDKQGKNELRSWPDWRTADPTKAIEHEDGIHD